MVCFLFLFLLLKGNQIKLLKFLGALAISAKKKEKKKSYDIYLSVFSQIHHYGGKFQKQLCLLLLQC